MGGLRKRDMHTMMETLAFFIGKDNDPDLDLKMVELHEPIGQLPAWSPKKGVTYFHVWKDIQFDQIGESGVARVMAIFRVNKHTFDKPRYFNVNDYGIFEFKPFRQKKHLLKQTKDAKTGQVKKEEDVETGPWDMKWEVVDEWPFYCQKCGRTKKRCVCDQVHLIKNIRKWQSDQLLESFTCPKCGGPVDVDLYEYETKEKIWAEARWKCGSCDKTFEIDIKDVEKVNKHYLDLQEKWCVDIGMEKWEVDWNVVL